MANINLKGEEWTPIPEFTGILNGNGYKIYNFTLRQNGVDLGFVITNSGTIKNVTFSNVELTSTMVDSIDCSVGVIAAHNTGRLINVKLEKTNLLVNVSSINVFMTVSVGGMVGDNTGILTSCSSQCALVFKDSIQVNTGYGTTVTTLYVAGMVGKNSGLITAPESVFTLDVEEWLYVRYYDQNTVNLHIGGISGAEYGNITDGTATIMCTFASIGEAYGWSTLYRYTWIGGITGCTYETSAIRNCCSKGSMVLARTGIFAEGCEFATGGIIGKVESGTVNNCASAVDITVKEGYGGTVGGIVGLVGLNGTVSNLAYYGQIKTESFTDGWFGGLAGWTEGALTKSYFHGKILSESTQKADIAANITNSGSVSKVIGNGNTRLAYVTNNGSVSYGYIIGVDYGAEMLLDAQTLFGELCLFEADIWAVDEETGLYLIAFPENTLGGEEE